MEVVSVIMNETLRRDTLLWLKRHRAPRAPQDVFSCALLLFLDLAGHSDFGLAEQLFVKQTLDETKPSPTQSRRLTLSSCWRHWEPYQMQAPRARTGASVEGEESRRLDAGPVHAPRHARQKSPVLVMTIFNFVR